MCYFLFIYKDKKRNKDEQIKTLKNLFAKFSISLGITLPLFLLLSRPIPLTKIFDIDDFKDVTHFGVDTLEAPLSEKVENANYFNNFFEETRIEFLNIISEFKVKRFSKKEESLPRYLIEFYQNKYPSQSKSKLGTITDSGYLMVGTKKYKVINYEDLSSKLDAFINDNSN